MKISLALSLVLALLPAGLCAEKDLPADARELRIGDAAPDFSLPGIDGKTYTLGHFKQAELLMVIFLSNHCPFSHAAEDRLLPWYDQVKSRGVAIVAINPNHPDAVRIDELGYSKYNDSFEEMRVYAKEKGFNFPYLYDGETQATAKAYGCLATPHVFLFDRQRKLRYAGRFDDSRFPDPKTVTAPDAPNAVEALLAGRAVPVELTRVMGCSTKWLSKKDDALKIDAQWNVAPVTLETISAEQVKALARNDTPKLRLINVWATWCSPCVKEFPGFVSLARRLGSRDFEFISISMDEMKDLPKAKAFLEKRGAGLSDRLKKSVKEEGRKSNSYIFKGTQEDLVKALDPEWPGPIPHTLLIDTKGKVLWRHNGQVNGDELRAKILEHLGTYYTP